jgi:hypothetical protein
VIFSNEVCSTFTAMNSRTLLSDYVYPFPTQQGALNILFCISRNRLRGSRAEYIFCDSNFIPNPVWEIKVARDRCIFYRKQLIV